MVVKQHPRVLRSALTAADATAAASTIAAAAAAAVAAMASAAATAASAGTTTAATDTAVLRACELCRMQQRESVVPPAAACIEDCAHQLKCGEARSHCGLWPALMVRAEAGAAQHQCALQGPAAAVTDTVGTQQGAWAQGQASGTLESR